MYKAYAIVQQYGPGPPVRTAARPVAKIIDREEFRCGNYRPGKSSTGKISDGKVSGVKGFHRESHGPGKLLTRKYM